MIKTHKIINLRPEEINEIRKSVKKFSMATLISVLFIPLIVALYYFELINSTVFAIFLVAFMILSGLLFVMMNNRTEQLKSGKKKVITGTIDKLIIDSANYRCKYERIGESEVKIEMRSASGTKTVQQNVELAPGERDEYFYVLQIGDDKIQISRAQFFSLHENQEIGLELYLDNELISLTVRS